MSVLHFRKLRGGETQSLTQNYYDIKVALNDYSTTIDDVFTLYKNQVQELNEDEIVYLYYELYHSQCRYDKNISDIMQIMLKSIYKERLINEQKESTKDSIGS